MLSIIISTHAEAELDDTGKCYDKRLPGLSFHFSDEIDDYLNKVRSNPLAFSARKEGSNTRRYSLKKFLITSFTW